MRWHADLDPFTNRAASSRALECGACALYVRSGGWGAAPADRTEGLGRWRRPVSLVGGPCGCSTRSRRRRSGTRMRRSCWRSSSATRRRSCSRVARRSSSSRVARRRGGRPPRVPPDVLPCGAEDARGSHRPLAAPGGSMPPGAAAGNPPTGASRQPDRGSGPGSLEGGSIRGRPFFEGGPYSREAPFQGGWAGCAPPYRTQQRNRPSPQKKKTLQARRTCAARGLEGARSGAGQSPAATIVAVRRRVPVPLGPTSIARSGGAGRRSSSSRRTGTAAALPGSGRGSDDSPR
jgi:hypothetical protein